MDTEKRKAQKKAYYEANKEKILKLEKAYRENNKELIVAKRKTWYEANKEAKQAKAKAYTESNKEMLSLRRKAQYKKHRLRNIWHGMKRRCYNTEHIHYGSYGQRGITVCDEWKHDYTAFEAWALANGYESHLTIDRINNDGNYEPGNCQWLTRAENRRKQYMDKKTNQG
jgi:hypothetical protein